MADRTYTLMAQALRYPSRGQVARLQQGGEEMPSARVAKPFREFVQRIEALTLAEREELYTRTLDLNPVAAPYVGYQVWGDSYKRGNFMAQMNRSLRDAGVSTDGELPDHLAPVLNYLGAAEQPPPELVEALPKALTRIQSQLKKAEPDNPYILLFEAISQALKSLEKSPNDNGRSTTA